jgi:thiol:disulfide interchange protein DsbA
MSRDYGLSGVPALVVDGKYLVGGKSSAQETLKTLDDVINMARKERAKK